MNGRTLTWAALAVAVVVAAPGPVSGTVAAPPAVRHQADPLAADRAHPPWPRDLRPGHPLVTGPCAAPPVELSVPRAQAELRYELHRLSRHLDRSPRIVRPTPGTIPLPVEVGPLCTDARPFRQGSPGIQLIKHGPGPGSAAGR